MLEASKSNVAPCCLSKVLQATLLFLKKYVRFYLAHLIYNLSRHLLIQCMVLILSETSYLIQLRFHFVNYL